MWYVWPVGMFIYSSIYKITRMPSISLDKQPTKHWVTKESRSGGLCQDTSSFRMKYWTKGEFGRLMTAPLSFSERVYHTNSE
jgi:hypothetical protein